jgi:hypothetical protein
MVADSGERDVVVVGSGPNGLAAAITCADAGLSVEVLEAQPEPGGGCRTVGLDLGAPLRHDLCSAVHPMAMASPFFQSLGLAASVEFGQPEIAYAHPLDGGRGSVAYRDLERTASELSEQGRGEGRLYRRVMKPLVAGVDAVVGIGLSDVRRVPATILRPEDRRGPGVGVSHPGPPGSEVESLPHVAAGCLSVLRQHAARTGCARNVRRACGDASSEAAVRHSQRQHGRRDEMTAALGDCFIRLSERERV